MTDDSNRALAERIRQACIDAALNGYEQAAMAGLCGEGALEAAISGIRMLDLETVVASTPSRLSQGRF